MKFIEYWIYKVDGDLWTEQGQDWRMIRRLAEECKQGMHPDIEGIDRVERSTTDSDYAEYESLYKAVMD